MYRLLFFVCSVFVLMGCDEKVSSTGSCGDGVVDANEECDGPPSDDLSCVDLGYHGGVLSCNDDCTLELTLCEAEGRCGDGTVQEGYETCEPGVSSEDCAAIGRGEGTAPCSESCQYDYSDCSIQPACGDGYVIVENGEECDGTNLNGETCETLHYYGGVLTCKDDCTYDRSSCEAAGQCGDGTLQAEGGETCDGTDFGGASCEDSGFYPGGSLACNSDCSLDTSGCAGECGDGVTQSGQEECDISDLNGESCASQGFHGGPLLCNSGCNYDTSQCDTFATVSVGFSHTCATTTGGKTYCWGDNAEGQLGDGTTTGRLTPTEVQGFGFSPLNLGHSHSCGVTGGDLFCFGSNIQRQLGIGTNQANASTPTEVSTNTSVSQVASGAGHSCLRYFTGSTYCWGSNSFGQLGTSLVSSSNSPVPIDLVPSTTPVDLSAGYNTTCVLKSNGDALCWGGNDHGQLGDNTLDPSDTPVPVQQGSLNFTKIAVGVRTVCALTTSGAAYCWGQNAAGEVGNGTTLDAYTPEPVSGSHTFSQITVGNNVTCGITTAQEALCWGSNVLGSLGNGTTEDSMVPVAVSGGHLFSTLSAYGSHVCGVTTEGILYCWGANSNGQLGDGTTDDRLVPTRVLSW